MKIAALIQARLGSSRLPGKVMMEIWGKPLIGYLVDRLECCDEPDTAGVAIPAGDHVLREYLEERDFPVFCSERDENDVAGRFLDAAEQCGADAICRICGDSPLLDPMLIDDGCEVYRGLEPEICFNRQVAFPRGQSVEIISVGLLKEAYPFMDSEDREHVTRFFRRRLENYACIVWSADVMRDPPSFLVDTKDDFEHMSRLIGAMKLPHTDYGWEELVKLEESLCAPAS